jgi:hypothetical protein
MQYSVTQRTHMGNPVVEILVDGQPWGADRLGPEHFSFGLTKARMIRAALPVITQFADSLGGNPWPGQTKSFTDLTGAGIIAVDVTKHDEFAGVGGVQVNQPYLEIRSGQTSLGLGVRKCQAILDLCPRIDAFLSDNGHQRLFAG